jgi:hypothetical protein
MRYSLLLLSFISASYSLPLMLRADPQDLTPQLLKQLDNLNTAVTELTAAVNNFDGSLLSLLPQGLGVVGTETKVDVTVLKAKDIAQQSSNFTAEESTEVVQTLATQIGPIQSSLDAIKAKVCIAMYNGELRLSNMIQYPVFHRTLTAPIVLLDLKILKKHTDELIAAVKEKVTPDNAGLLDFGAGILDQAFDDAIAVYN